MVAARRRPSKAAPFFLGARFPSCSSEATAMQLTVRGKQIDVGDALRTHVSDALTSTTAKYFNNAIEANVVFSRNAHLIRSDLSVTLFCRSRTSMMAGNWWSRTLYISRENLARGRGPRTLFCI